MANNGTSDTYPMQCSKLKKNGYVMIKGRPCKIVKISSKVHLVAHDIFTGKNYEDVFPSTQNMDVPNVKTTDYLLLDVEGEYLSLENEGGEMKEDVKVPEGDLGKDILNKFNNGDAMLITVASAVGEEGAVGTKSGH